MNQFMLIALEEAKKALIASEVPVGAVIVHRDDGKVIALSHNQVENLQNPTMHAEMLVINAACELLKVKNLSEYDLYVTLEPCAMCACAISHARIGRLFYGASEPKTGAVENGVRFFTSKNCHHRPEIYPGIMAEESKGLLQDFFKNLR